MPSPQEVAIYRQGIRDGMIRAANMAIKMANQHMPMKHQPPAHIGLRFLADQLLAQAEPRKKRPSLLLPPFV